MKKIIALLIVLTMCIASVPVFADDSAPYANANGIKTNAIVDASNAGNFDQFNATREEITPQNGADGSYFSWIVKSNIKPGGMYEAYLKGAVLRVNDEFGINTNFKVPAGKALVFQMPVKNVGNTSSVTVNAALINSGNWGEANVPIECGDKGFEVTDTENWGIVSFTIVMPGTQGQEYKPRLFFGFPEGTLAGQAIAINLNTPGIPKAFVAVEEVYRVKVSSDYSKNLNAGDKVNLTATVYNQIGSKGALNQDAIEWFVTDADRTTKIEGKDFSIKADKNTAVLTVNASAEAGNYSVIAQSTENPEIRYGIDIKVGDAPNVQKPVEEKPQQPVEPQKPAEPEKPAENQGTATPAVSFADVHGVNHWSKEYVDYVTGCGLMNGTSADKFSPNGLLTRGMLVTVLYRMDGSPVVNGNTPFADVKTGAYYEKAVAWASAEGIVNGVNSTTFAPDSSITREQIASIMYRYAKYKGYDVSVGENTNILSYDDFDKIASYAIPAIQYVVGSGIINGKTPSTVNPKDNATRAELAAILKRFNNK